MKAKLLTMLILITGLYGGLSVNAQTQSISNPFQALESNPYLMPPTPDVAAFLNYGQYSVSQASGKVDITIPIYEIQTRDLNFPITLSYIGGGIKVTDQASWAGLGWVLNAGGVVNHTVQGLPDKHWFPELPTADEIREDNDHSSLYKTIATVNGGLNGTDKMRDRYDYSFGQGGGTFYITSYEEYLQTPYTENKIKRLLNSAKTRTAGFVITDDKGVSYHFEKPENSTVLSTSYNHSDSHTYALAEEYTYDSAWYLTKIVSMNQKDSITFVYGTDSESYTDHKLSHSYSVTTNSVILNVERHISSTVNTRKVNSTPILQKIVFEQGYILFESTADRKDNRSYRITGIKVYNSNDDLIREVDFSHSYFGGNRLKLDKVTFKGRDGEIYDSVEFDYYNASFHIASWIPNHYGHLNVGEVNRYYSQDYMGYYNGAENRSLIGYFPQDDYNYSRYAADRNHSAEHAKIHSLKSMTYMSGAQTDFIYDTENYIKPRNPGIKVKEIISTDPISNICLKKVYSYSGCKLATSFPYESQMFVDYSINVAPEVALTYVTKTYTSDPLVYGYESGWQALYKRIEERIVDSTNPSDTMLVVKTYDISSSDFVDTGYYLNGYGRTTEAYADWQQQLALIPLGLWPTLNSLQDGMVPEKYNVPGYFVNNGWEEGQLLKEEVYKTVSNGYKLYRSKENRYTKYLSNSRVPMEIDEKKKRMLLYAALLVVFGGISVFMLRDPSAGNNDEGSRNIVIEIPEGETDVLNESKSSAYKGRQRHPNEVYYDRLGTVVADTGHISLTSVATDDTKPVSERSSENDILVGEVFPENKPRAASSGTVRKSPRPRQSVPVMTPEERMEYDLKRAEAMRQALMEEPDVQQEKEPVIQEIVKPESFSFGGDGIISSLDGECAETVSPMAKPARCMFVKDEKVKNGQRVGIRILEDFRCGSIVIPENTHLSAVCSLSGRLELMVNGFEMNGRIYPINLKAYDTDGYEGIYCPETAAVKGRKKVTGEVVSTAGTALSGLVGGVTGKILRTGASLLTSASGEQSVQIASGYEFYLMEEPGR